MCLIAIVTPWLFNTSWNRASFLPANVGIGVLGTKTSSSCKSIVFLATGAVAEVVLEAAVDAPNFKGGSDFLF